MTRFILLTFGFLGWAYFEMSGGTDFRPQSEVAARTAPVIVTPDASSPPAPKPDRVVAASATVTQIAAEAPMVQLAALETPAAAPPKPRARPKPAAVPTADVPLTRRESVALPANPDLVELAALDPPAPDIRKVTGSRVNLRQGPGTRYPVLARLTRGEAVEVLRREGNWLKLRVVDNPRIGWMSAKLVTAKAE